MIDVTIRGASDLADLSAKMKAVGNNDLRKEMLRGIRTATKPMIEAARDSARDNLPSSGGLNEIVATSKFGTRTRTAGRSPGVRVVGTSGISIGAIDQGRLRHPTFGHDPWVTQSVKPKWFTGAMESSADEVRHELVKVIDDIARKF